MKTKFPSLTFAFLATALPVIANELEPRTFTPPNGPPITYYQLAEPRATIALYVNGHGVVVSSNVRAQRDVRTRTIQVGNSTQVDLPGQR